MRSYLSKLSWYNQLINYINRNICSYSKERGLTCNVRRKTAWPRKSSREAHVRFFYIYEMFPWGKGGNDSRTLNYICLYTEWLHSVYAGFFWGYYFFPDSLQWKSSFSDIILLFLLREILIIHVLPLIAGAETANILGLRWHSYLSWEIHIEYMKGKCNAALCVTRTNSGPS